MENTTQQNSPIKVGDYVKFENGGVEGIYEVISVNLRHNTCTIKDYYSTYSVSVMSVEKVEEPYFIDCDWFHTEDETWHGDLGYEADIDDIYCETLEEVKSGIKYDLEAMEENGELNDNEIIRFSAVKGVYDFECECWRCPCLFDRENHDRDRENRVVYRYLNATKDVAEKYGIIADEYAE